MILVDGRESTTIPADDRGLAYGDGVFETIPVRAGRLPLLDYHLERLSKGLRALGIGEVDVPVLRDELEQAASRFPQGVVKLIVTRGSGGRGYRPNVSTTPRRIVQGMAAPEHVARWQREGVTLCTCETRLSGPPELAGLKHLNRLSHVLARAEWDDEFDEGLMRNANGEIVEGTMSNIFMVRDGELLTAPVGLGVEGVMRRFVLELAHVLNISSQVRPLHDEEISNADALFITNSVIGICPVKRYRDKGIPIGTIVRTLQAAAERELDRRCEN